MTALDGLVVAFIVSLSAMVLTAFLFVVLLAAAPKKPVRKSKFGACTATTSCSMRKKVLHTALLVPPERCGGIPDAIIDQWIQYDQAINGKTPLGRPILKWAYCPWCGEICTWQKLWNEAAPTPEENEGEEWKNPHD